MCIGQTSTDMPLTLARSKKRQLQIRSDAPIFSIALQVLLFIHVLYLTHLGRPRKSVITTTHSEH